MIKPKCPHCLNVPKIGFWKRRMMESYGGAPCSTCQTILIPPKWEQWAMMPIFFIPLVISHYFGETLHLGKTALLTTLIALIYVYIIAALVPWKVQARAE